LVPSNRGIHLPRWGWAVVAVVLIIGVVGTMRGRSGSSNPPTAATESAPAATAPPAKPTTAPKPSAVPPTPVPPGMVVVNAGAEGVSLRTTAGDGERLKIWKDGALMLPLGGEIEAAGRPWKQVRDAEGNEGWMAAEFLKSVDMQERAAFLDYGKRLWSLALQSDQSDKTMYDALTRFSASRATLVDVYQSAQANGAAQQRHFASANTVQTTPKGKPIKDALQGLLLERKDTAEKLAKAADTQRTSDIAAVRASQADSQRIGVRFAAQVVTIGSEVGVDLDALGQS
jgi:hypothetical protein